MVKRTEEELEELKRLRDEMAEWILSRGIDEGHLDAIINEDKDEEK